MKIRDIIREGDPQKGPSVLLTTLELLRNHASDKGMPPVISTNQLIDLVKQPGMSFTYASLVDAYKKEPAIKKIIKSFNREEVILSNPDGEDEFTTSASVGVDLGTDTVSRMAHNALNKRQ